MRKNRSLIIVGAVFQSAALAAILISSNKNSLTTTQPSLAANSDVWVYNCEIPEQRPELLMLTCGDGGMRLEDLMWAVWDKNGAVGYGTYLENDCQPSCAEGTYSRTSVYATLGEITEINGRNFLNSLVITADQEGELPGGQPSISWDLPKPSEDDLLSG